MTESRLASFLAGERPDDIAIYLPTETVSDADSLLETEYGEGVENGVVLIVEGEKGQATFEEVTGTDPMTFAGSAIGTPGHVDADLTGGECPNAIEGSQEHSLRFIFAFAEEQNEEVGGIYAEGDVIHAYAQCACGETYSDKWVVGERA